MPKGTAGPATPSSEIWAGRCLDYSSQQPLRRAARSQPELLPRGLLGTGALRPVKPPASSLAGPRPGLQPHTQGPREPLPIPQGGQPGAARGHVRRRRERRSSGHVTPPPPPPPCPRLAPAGGGEARAHAPRSPYWGGPLAPMSPQAPRGGLREQQERSWLDCRKSFPALTVPCSVGGGPASRDTPSPVDPESVEVLMTFEPDPADLALSSVPGQDTFDPRKHRFSEEELKPQPIMKKARKMQVPEEQKDEKYWSRRYKNNEAAKRSRDARRLKENQISVRAAFLEKENALLRQEVVAVRQELSHYRAVLSRYQAQHGAL
ncbi:D site-binding protein isoform X2 [Notamacropus eugenii]|uniref:D site-binding protein isoform X2 n=1 Tax=Notamacropus eugenii TaxID=9315 RepID=UPI003B678C1B